MTDIPFRNYRQLLEKIDRVASRLRQEYPRSFACKPGCSACCVGGITVWRVEHDHIHEALSSLPETTASPVRPELVEGRPVRASTGSAQPGICPLLDIGGRCAIYDARPAVCRLWGLPILIPAGSEAEWGLRGNTFAAASTGGSVICCDLNFTTPPALDDLPQTALISAQTTITTLAAINHVYCRSRGLDPEERLPLPAA